MQAPLFSYLKIRVLFYESSDKINNDYKAFLWGEMLYN